MFNFYNVVTQNATYLSVSLPVSVTDNQKLIHKSYHQYLKYITTCNYGGHQMNQDEIFDIATLT